MAEPTKLDQFFQWVRERNLVAPFVKLKTRTQPKLLAAARIPFPLGVERLSTRLVQLGANYENVVRNATQVLDFKAEALWGGKGRHVASSRYLVEHVDKPGEAYLAFRPREKDSIVEDQWVDLAKKTIIGEPIDFLPKRVSSKTGVEWRVVKLGNVVAVTCGEITVEL